MCIFGICENQFENAHVFPPFPLFMFYNQMLPSITGTHTLPLPFFLPLTPALFLTCKLNKFCCHKYKCHTFICYLAPGRGQGNPEGVKQRVLLLFSLLQSTFSVCPSRTLALKTLHCLLSMHIKVIPGSSLRTQIQLAVENFLWSGLY